MIRKYKQLDFFKDTEYGKSLRLSISQAMDLTTQSLNAYGKDLSTWVVGFSGGKDSTATLTFIDWAIQNKKLQRPDNLIAVYSDTLMELPSLEQSAYRLLDHISRNGWRVIKTEPLLETKPTKTERFFVTMLGRGYPPPSNRFRWCTDRMKASKIDNAYKIIESEYGNDFLGIDGIRKGESAARDQIIVASCSTDDGECGQGWFHKNQRGNGYKLSPLLHWRLCHVWDWIFLASIEHGYPIDGVIDTYGINIDDDLEDMAGRTGCIGCPLVTATNKAKPREDKALNTVLLSERWSHLEPYRGLASVYWELRWNSSMRHFKSNGKKGCLTLNARRWALEKILKMQNRSIELALEKEREAYLIIRPDEEIVIRRMIDDRTFVQPKAYPDGEFAKDVEVTFSSPLL